MSETLKLSAELILEKKFRRDLKGYDAYEVDEFLDKIILDYQNLEQYVTKNDAYVSSLQAKISELQANNARLSEDNSKLSLENKNLEMELANMNNRYGGIKESDRPSAENLHLLKRINALEAFFRAQGYSDSDLENILGKE